MTRVLVIGSFKSERELDGPKQLRQTYDLMRGSDPHDRVSVLVWRNFGQRIVRIESPYGIAQVKA